VAVDVHQLVDAGAGERGGDVVDHGVQGHGADADGAGEGRMLVAARDGDGWENVYGGGVGDLPGYDARDRRIGDQGEVLAALLKGADGEHRDLRLLLLDVGARGGRQQIHGSRA
jgi:hypothetical protein